MQLSQADRHEPQDAACPGVGDIASEAPYTLPPDSRLIPALTEQDTDARPELAFRLIPTT